jgi:tetratricopeptide (TPR) repeat protein
MRRPEEPSLLRREAARAAARGERAHRARRWAAAAQAYGRAADVLAALDDGAGEAELRQSQGDALRRAGDLDAALAAHERAVALDTRGGDAAARARDLAGLAQTHRARGDVARAIATAEEARLLAAATPAVTATLENDLATYLLARGDSGDRERILALLASARRTNRSRGDRHAVAVNDLNLARAHLAFGDPEAAADAVGAALDAFRALDDPEGLAPAHELLGMLAARRGERAESLHHWTQARDTFAFLGDEAGRRRVERRLGGAAVD